MVQRTMEDVFLSKNCASSYRILNNSNSTYDIHMTYNYKSKITHVCTYKKAPLLQGLCN